MKPMEEVNVANKKLKTAHDDFHRDYRAQIDKLNSKEEELLKRLGDLEKKKMETAQANGDVHAAAGDLLEINAGGKVISAKRSTLTQLRGTRLEALFSGRWDKKLQRDSRGRIFLDVNPVCFQAIVDYLHELAISSEDDPPTLPSVDDDHTHILHHQMDLFGIDIPKLPESSIVKDGGHVNQLHDWLKDGSDRAFRLLYRSSGDGATAERFHSKCDNQGCTVTIIETACGYVLGGYSNASWTSDGHYHQANKALLFVLSGTGIDAPVKMKLRNAYDSKAVFHSDSYGPYFGGGKDLKVTGNISHVHLKLGDNYESGPPELNAYGSSIKLRIKEMEVFQVSEMSSWAAKGKKVQTQLETVEPVVIFTKGINEAINKKQESLSKAGLDILNLEESYQDEADFVSNFASGEAKDVVALNVSGTIMATKRSSLCSCADSVLAQQFDDAKWTEQGCNAPLVKEWTADDVCAWAESIEGVQEDAASILKRNRINGCELLALNMEGLKMIGIERVGTLCLLLEGVKLLKQASLDKVTLIEHSPYCFGKILDYLRLKHLQCQGLAGEPALPLVCDSQKRRFDKVVKYFFPGDSAKFILG